MSWHNLPCVSDTTDIAEWKFIQQFQLAMVEREWAAGVCVFPRSNRTWWTGTVASVTNNTLTDSTAVGHWAGGSDDTSGHTDFIDPWDNIRAVYVPLTAHQYPTIWWLVIDDNDPNKCVRTRIKSWTNAGVLSFDQIKDMVTAGRLANLSDFNGKTYHIIGYSYAVWWHERLMETPNDYEFAKGTVKTLTNQTDDLGNKLPDSPDVKKKFFRDNDATWQADEHKGRDLLAYGVDADTYGNSYLHRIAILGNDKNTITYAAQTNQLAVDRGYIIVATGKMGFPERDPTYPFWWYRGQRAGYASHEPVNDTVGSAPMPVATFKVPACTGICIDGSCATCDGYNAPVWDETAFEWWSDFPVDLCDDSCGRLPDKLYAGKDSFKTLRACQGVAETISALYVEAKSYNGVSGNPDDPLGAIPLINPAKMFSLAGINSQTGTTGDVADGISSSINNGHSNNEIAITGVTAPYYPIQCHYAITTYTGEFLWGKGYLPSAGRLLDQTGDPIYHQQDDTVTPHTPGVNGRAVIISFGWTRYVSKTFKRMFNNGGVFIPDVHTDIGTGLRTAIDPPAPDGDFSTTHDCYGVGTFPKKVKSSRYIERKRELQSYAGPEGFAVEDDNQPFVTGDLARYVGDNFFDSTQDGAIYSPTDPIQRYTDRFYVGQHNTQHQHLLDSQNEGKVTSAATSYIFDQHKNWYDFGTFSGTVYVMTGTATGGSTTTLVDSTKVETTPDTPSNPQACYWGSVRFHGDAAYIGFTLEVDFDDGNGNTVTEKRLITSSDRSTGTLTVGVGFSQATTGKVWRINEPYALNRFIDRQIIIYKPDGTTLTATVTGNGQDYIFFTALPEAPKEGWVYKIIDPEVGGVWKWDGTKWIVPTGADTVRLGVTVPADFHKNQTENLEHLTKRYGRIMQGDVMHSGVFDEMRAAYNVLLHTRGTFYWTSRAVDSTLEKNFEAEGCSGTAAVGSTSLSDWEAAAQGCAEGLWGSNPVEQDGLPPRTSVLAHDDGDAGCTTYNIARRYAYGVVSGICNRQKCSIDYYDFGDNPGNFPTASCPNGIGFNSYGDAVGYHQWTVFASHGPANYTTDRAKLGSLSMPSGAYCGVEHTTNQTGYEITEKCAILKWNVTGGMVYTG